jgi:hypothetical protein
MKSYKKPLQIAEIIGLHLSNSKKIGILPNESFKP